MGWIDGIIFTESLSILLIEGEGRDASWRVAVQTGDRSDQIGSDQIRSDWIRAIGGLAMSSQLGSSLHRLKGLSRTRRGAHRPDASAAAVSHQRNDEYMDRMEEAFQAMHPSGPHTR